jgi:hypothetical protein
VLGINERSGAAQLLAFGNGLQGQGGLARGFRAVDFHHAALGQAADTQRNIQHQRTRRNHLDRLDHTITHTHHRAFAELLFDLAQGGGKGTLLVLVHRIGPGLGLVRLCLGLRLLHDFTL